MIGTLKTYRLFIPGTLVILGDEFTSFAGACLKAETESEYTCGGIECYECSENGIKFICSFRNGKKA